MKFKAVLALVLVAALSSCGGKKAVQAQAHFKLGVSYLSDGSLQPAFVEFQKAADLDPDNKEVQNAIGVVYLRLQDYRNSEEAFKRATNIDSDYSEAYNNLCFLYNTGRQWKKAVEQCKKALKNPIYATPEKAFYNMGQAYYRLGMHDEAIEAYNDALRRAPVFYMAYYGLALAHNAKGEYGQASTEITRGIELDPRFGGNRAKAEAGFKAEQAGAGEPKDFKDLIEILNY